MIPQALVTFVAMLLAAPLPGAPIPLDSAASLAAPLSDFAARAAGTPDEAAPAAYLPASREVTNWRSEAARHLDLAAADREKLEAGRDPASIGRCVRLDNYWCIKKAGWKGEIAADGEGHVAFASSLEGATVAAVLLRRYYLDYGRKSALAIVSHWAPASCGPTLARVETPRRAAGRRVATAPDALSAHGVGNTLRARWLASHRGGHGHRVKVAKARTSPARTRVAARLPDLMPAPSIMAGGGEKAIPLPTIRLASLGLDDLGVLPPPGPLTPAPAPTCTADNARIAAYAAAVAKDVVARPTDDLALFAPDGTPGQNLAKVMLAMAAVEIGPRRVLPALVEAAIAEASRVRTANRKD